MRTARFLAAALFLFGMGSAQAQNCPEDCENLAPTGDMSQITTSGQGGLNAMNIDWKSSHGSPSYSPGQLWMWSYNNNGEGVYYDAFTFLAGHTYCIRFDTDTRTHDGSPADPNAGFHVMATNGLTPSEIGGCCQAIPPIPPGDVILDQNWSTLPMGGSTNHQVIFTATSNWSQLWFHPYSPGLPQVEVTLRNLRICDITISDPCQFDAQIDYQQFEGGCGFQFYSNLFMAPGLTAVQYLWDFGDGNTSTNPNPVHYYASGGGYLVKLTVLVINENGECCVRTFERWVEAHHCDPCTSIQSFQIFRSSFSGTTGTFTTYGPNTPNYIYQWTFSDGGSATGHTVTHTFPGYGNWTAYLTIYYFDADGNCCSAKVKRTFKFLPPINPGDPTGPVEPGDPGEPIPIGGKAASNPSNKPVPAHIDFPEELKERPVTTTERLEVFPNPTSGTFTVAADEKIVQIDVIDNQGRVIQTVKADKKSTDVSLQSQKTGTYTLSIVLESGRKHTQTIVKN